MMGELTEIMALQSSAMFGWSLTEMSVLGGQVSFLSDCVSTGSECYQRDYTL